MPLRPASEFPSPPGDELIGTSPNGLTKATSQSVRSLLLALVGVEQIAGPGGALDAGEGRRPRVGVGRGQADLGPVAGQLVDADALLVALLPDRVDDLDLPGVLRRIDEETGLGALVVPAPQKLHVVP